MDHSLASILWRIAGVLALVFANGFFVAAEFSIVTVRIIVAFPSRARHA